MSNIKAAKKGGGVAKKARVNLEKLTNKKVITSDNFLLKSKEQSKIS